MHLKNDYGDIHSILEIGAHEGRSTCWMLENMLHPNGSITVIDPFAGTHRNAFDSHAAETDNTIENRFRRNVAQAKKPSQHTDIRVGLSFNELAQLIVENKQFDFIYVDGNHCSDAALADAVMCFGLLKPGGMMLFDDYLWEDDPDNLNRCKASIDAFCNMFVRKIDFMLINYQLGIRKKPTKLVSPVLSGNVVTLTI